MRGRYTVSLAALRDNNKQSCVSKGRECPPQAKDAGVKTSYLCLPSPSTGRLPWMQVLACLCLLPSRQSLQAHMLIGHL